MKAPCVVLALFGLVVIAKEEEIPQAVNQQVEALLKPTIKLACCTEAGIEDDLKKCVACIPDKDLVAEISKKTETYKKDKSNYCDDKGNPKDAAITAAIDKEKAAFKADTNKGRFLKAVCVKPCLESTIKKYKEKCKIE